MGGASRETNAATFPPNTFYCLLDELPRHLIPRPFRMYWSADFTDEQPLYLNPNCVLLPDGQAPEETSNDLLSGFARQGTIAWVRESTGSFNPFWLGPKFEGYLHGLHAGDEISSGVPRSAKAILAAAGILVPRSRIEQASSDRKSAAEDSIALFREKGYTPLNGLIHPFHVAALRRYYRYLIRSGTVWLGDGQSNRRYVAHNDPVARFFHYQIARRISELAGNPLKPSYVYMASYLSGAELKKHTDREQCEYSVTFCLDFSPEPLLATPWPIQLDTATGSITVYQALGDGLAYRGTQLPHYRRKLEEGQTSTSIFFHYVSEDFTGPLE